MKELLLYVAPPAKYFEQTFCLARLLAALMS